MPLHVESGDGEIRINVVVPMGNRAAEIIGKIGAAGDGARNASAVDCGSLKQNAKLGIWHTPNFAVVKWGAETFAFTPAQARVVAALVTASRRGFEWLDQETLLAEAQSDGGRLLPLFRGHPAWNRWIVSATPISERPATWRLADLV